MLVVPANYISNEVKAYMEKQQSVIDRLTEMMATMKKETSDPQVFVTSENSAKVTCQFCDKSVCQHQNPASHYGVNVLPL
jgi:uncharacterized Zn-finger protein